MQTVIVMAHRKPFTTACPARQGLLAVPGQHRTQPCVAQQQPAPQKGAENDAKDDGKPAILVPYMRGDRAAEIARQQDGTQRRGPLTVLVGADARPDPQPAHPAPQGVVAPGQAITVEEDPLTAEGVRAVFSAWTVNHGVIAVKTCWSWGVKNDLLPFNPLQKVQKLDTEGRERTFTQCEFLAL